MWDTIPTVKPPFVARATAWTDPDELTEGAG